ncbi:zona pellucida sperm-binding protein 3-like [Pimephales promelas]|uniref:zona pellucida sperm-binding protein 3-like n=1 Tax=Pimephales promelas TaxID=90988 RepID=UPI0019555607|nr:zona pellucida sperm-binding protein 3-like [Pimephales promelas]
MEFLKVILEVVVAFDLPDVLGSLSLVQEPFGLQGKQLLQGPVKPLDWRYPIVPEVQSQLVMDFQLRQPVTPSSVVVQCGENRVLVEFQQDFFQQCVFCVDDWSYQRPSYSYFLGGVINIKASVKQFNLVPLRVFLDSCVATQVPDVNSLRRYSFIENHRCFVDAKTTASSSRFMPRSQVDKIQFQLEAFMFQESNRPSIFITCLLKASRNPVPLPMGGLLLIMTKFMVAVTEHVVLVNLLLLPMEAFSGKARPHLVL